MSSKREIRGILLEGVDYAGKSSISERVRQRISPGVAVSHGKCYHRRGALIDELERQAQEQDSLWARDCLYTACTIADLSRLVRLPDAELRATVRLQERAWYSQLARNEFFHPGTFTHENEVIAMLGVRYSVQIYLYSDRASKEYRIGGRVPKSPRDRLLAEDPDLHQAFDEASRANVPEPSRWQVIDISRRTIEEVADEVLLLSRDVWAAEFSGKVP